MSYSLSFGKYRGVPITEVPTKALKHYLAWEGLRDAQRTAIEAVLATREGGPTGQTPVPSSAAPFLMRSGAVRLTWSGPGRLRS
jgi:hypothetical protein